ncbi:type II toxin-antitoxin system HipA family toxin [Stenotrophomonas sp. YIM B06876]|uniref:type II toxin-antitoxin system HipA family toxin n=1 Tax=Stenotrophomonas sp. YIM B06876 TaxID=3060211 RepID=UPI002738C308|nr:type II toxin-antitoxin system HipA family toxin [Stenotrophomonas sp. YIM B06876]
MALTLLLSGRIAGRLEADGNGNPRLRYADTWLNTAGAYAVSLSLPLTQADFPPQAVSAVLWGLLPDNESLLQRWGTRFHVSPRNPVALLSHVGEDCAGAVQFVSDERLEDVLSGRDDQIEPLDDAELADRLRRLRQDNGMARNVDDVGQFSLAGAQSKIALLRQDDGSWAIPAGRVPTTHILKPPGGDYDGFVENEMFCLRLAQALGLPAATVEKIDIGGETAICVSRYDRARTNGNLVRVHQEDFCQALGVMPQIKYQSQGGPGPADLAKILWDHSSQPRTDVETLFQALAFNYLIGGTDAHAKNYSLLFGAGGNVRLAPLYDISSALPYPHLQKRKIKMAMKIGSHYRWWDIRPEDWQETATSMQLNPALALQILSVMCLMLPDTAQQAQQQLLSEGIEHPVLDLLVQEIRFSCERCIRKLQTTPAS